ncbi:MAG: hypothetical protein J5I92_03675 [Thiogranum sp.]|nr:hypothetical protein [Thiogranum sp.]
MNIPSLIIAGALGLMLAAFSLLLFAAIVFNLNIGKRYRRRLAREMERLRLAKMLAALGVDTSAWLHSERIVDIHNQMTRCAECAQTAECDNRLASGDVDPGQIGFCDNEQSLKELLEKQKHTASAER